MIGLSSSRPWLAAILASLSLTIGQASADGAKVPSTRAVEVFLAVCSATASKDFAGAPKAMARHGVTAKQESGTVFSEKEDLSFKIMDGPGFGRTCSMVFASDDSARTVQAALPRRAPFQDSPFGKATLTPEGFLVIYKRSNSGGRAYYNLQMLSDRG